MALDIVAIGHLINETIVHPGKEMRSVLGSPVAYSMTSAAALGKRVGIVSRIGNDYPEHLLAPLVELGIDTRGIIRSGELSTNNQLVYDGHGNKSIRYLSRAPDIQFDDVPEFYRDADILYACPMDWDMRPEVVRSLAECRGLVAIDLGGFGGAHSPIRDVPQMKRDVDALRTVVGAADIVKASDEDCRRITGDQDVDLDALARLFIRWGAETIVWTLGAAGATVTMSASRFDIPALPGKPVDPTGGGDSFMGGFLVNYLDTRDPWEAGLFAAATALLVIEGTGGVVASRMPRLEAVQKRLQSGRQALEI